MASLAFNHPVHLQESPNIREVGRVVISECTTSFQNSEEIGGEGPVHVEQKSIDEVGLGLPQWTQGNPAQASKQSFFHWIIQHHYCFNIIVKWQIVS